MLIIKHADTRHTTQNSQLFQVILQQFSSTKMISLCMISTRNLHKESRFMQCGAGDVSRIDVVTKIPEKMVFSAIISQQVDAVNANVIFKRCVQAKSPICE